MRIEIHLHGRFRTYHDGPLVVHGDTVAEAIEGMSRMVPGFAPHPVHGRQRVKVVGHETPEDLFRMLEADVVIHVVPQLNGGKQGSAVQFVLGAVLIAAAFATGFGFAAAGVPWYATALFNAGAMMVLGGVAQLLAPQPEMDADDQRRSRYLGAPKNTVEIGTRIPVLYGRFKVHGHYLSFDINAVKDNLNA